MSWVAGHLDLIAFAAWAVASVVGAALPESSVAGQWCRRIASDLGNKNLKAPPPGAS